MFFCYPHVSPSLLQYPGGNGGLNPLFGPKQVAVLNQLSQLNQLTQLNQISQLQVQSWTSEHMKGPFSVWVPCTVCCGLKEIRHQA